MVGAKAEALLPQAEDVGPSLKGLDRDETFPRLEAEYDDLVAALDWFVRDSRENEADAVAYALGR